MATSEGDARQRHTKTSSPPAQNGSISSSAASGATSRTPASSGSANGPNMPGTLGGQFNHQMQTPLPPYKNAGEYTQAVQQWVYQWHLWNNMNWVYMTFPFYAMSCMAAQQQQQGGLGGVGVAGAAAQSAQAAQPGQQRAAAAQVNAVPQNIQPQGLEFHIPPLWKRVLAEFLDFGLLFLIKLGVTILTVEYVGGIDMERYNLDVLLSQNIDYDTAYALTYELMAMEVINRILICIFETLCLRRGVGGIAGGTTPGKRMLGLRVVSCDDIIDLPEQKVRVVPAGDVGIWNALVRSVIKNFSLVFFFPVCFTVFFFQHNRAAYDIISNCIVVEATEDELLLWR